MPAETLEEIKQTIRQFVAVHRRMLIDGQWVNAKSGDSFRVYNPATGEVMANVAAGDYADIDLAVRAARRAFEQGPWSRMTHAERGKLIWKLADLIEENLEEFTQIESLDNGKPLSVARVADIPLAIDNFRYMSGWATKIEGQTISLSNLGQDYFAYTLREPLARSSVEFPAADGGLETRAGASCRVHSGT
jgi:phenylacetaldehyde dehydrogenase